MAKPMPHTTSIPSCRPPRTRTATNNATANVATTTSAVTHRLVSAAPQG